MPKLPKGANVEYYAFVGNDRTIDDPYSVIRRVHGGGTSDIQVWSKGKWKSNTYDFARFFFLGEVGVVEITPEKAQALIDAGIV